MVGLVPLLADLEDLPGGQLEEPAAGDRGGPQQDLGPGLGRRLAPGGRRGLGRGHGQLDLLHPGLADLAQDLGRIGRVGRGQAVGGHDLAAADEQRIDVAEPAPDIGQGLGEGASRRGHGQVEHGFVHERRQAAEARPRRGLGRRRALQLALQRQLRILEQAGDVGLVGEALLQKRFVGRVLQQPAHQVGHAGQKLAVGAVEPHPSGDLEEPFAHRLGHAVEHLEFKARLGHVQLASRLHDRADGPDVVRGALEVDQVVVLEDLARLALMGHVRLGLVGPDRHRPAVLLGQHRLVVPVGALDQPKPEGQAFLAAPGDEPGQVLVRVAQIGLEHQREVRPVAELGVGAQALEELDGQLRCI